MRILLLADTHLGFDLPRSARPGRRRRGPDFLANYARALEPALAGEVDLVVHGGDVFDMPDVPPSLAYQGLAPLVRVADRGVPVFVVPGNHERSRLPHQRFAAHPLVHIFDRPCTFTVEAGGARLALSGFPFERRDVRIAFPRLVEETGWRQADAALRLLCVHHCVEGATVGPGNFTFGHAPDVVRLRDVPPTFTAVLSGHIHRQQVLTRDLRGRPLATPVLYPGSVERTALAEKDERKGYLLLRAAPGGGGLEWESVPLPARPMLVREINTERVGEAALERALRAAVAGAPADAVLTIRLTGDATRFDPRLLSAARLRGHAPETMNIEIHTDVPFPRRRSPSRRHSAGGVAERSDGDAALHLDL
jgi:DNA repair protein SbcD/Mre11